MILKYWDDKCIIYHPESGNVHLLSYLNARILEQLVLNTNHNIIAEQLLINQNLTLPVTDKSDLLEIIKYVESEYKRINLLS